MIIFFDFYVFIIGLIIGSFLNVCISRLPKGESVLYPPSHCTTCGNKLKPIELIPVLSYIMLKAKCKNCNEKISIRYPIIEVLTAIVYAIIFSRFGLSINFFAALFLMTILIVVFFIDLDHQIIPDELVITGLVGSVALILYIVFTSQPVFEEASWLAHLLGALPGSGLLFLVALIGLVIFKSEEVMGMGDVKIFLPIGIFLGWKLCIFTMLISIVLAGLISIALVIFRLKKRKDTIPFGPFIVAGTFVALIWGNQILHWYIGMCF